MRLPARSKFWTLRPEIGDNDILFLKIEDREYHISKEYDNLVIDFTKNGKISGVQIFDMSELIKWVF